MHSVADVESSLAVFSPCIWQILYDISVSTDPHHNLSQLPINIISAVGQLVIICLVLLGSHSQTSSDSINDLNNRAVIIDADKFESYLISPINSVCRQNALTSNFFMFGYTSKLSIQTSTVKKKTPDQSLNVL